VSLGKINTIDKFRQFKNTSGFYSKKFNSIRKPNNLKNSNVSNKDKIANSKKTKKKKKIKKKKSKKIKEIEAKAPKTDRPEDTIDTNKINDISVYLSTKENLVTPFSKFEEGKPVIQYLFEDSKDVSDQEMFHFLLLTNQFFNNNLNK
jgi:hypothetical protein